MRVLIVVKGTPLPMLHHSTSPHHAAVQVLALKSNLQVAQNEKEALEKKLEALKEEMADSAKKEALRFHILLDMFGLQLLQTQPAKEVEDTLHSIAQH